MAKRPKKKRGKKCSRQAERLMLDQRVAQAIEEHFRRFERSHGRVQVEI